jgi:predicted permease
VSRVRALVLQNREEADLDDEIRFHIERETDKLIRGGTPAAEARRVARLRFGGVERMKERTRDERGVRGFDDALRDVRYGVRALRRAPTFTTVAVLTLSVGIGATTAMYSLVAGVLLDELPYPEAHRIVAVWERSDDGRTLHASYPNFSDWRSGAPSLAALAAFTPATTMTLVTPTGGTRAAVVDVSADFFRVGGVEPRLGRVPGPDENRPGGSPVAVVSHGFWSQALGRPADLTGVTLNVRGTPHEVIGVMPPGYGLPEAVDVWLPLDRAVPWTVRGNHVVGVLGRLADGADPGRAAAELDRVHASIRAASPEVETVGVSVRPLLDEVVGASRRPLWLLLGASGFLLLVACTNVAGTLFARGAGRRRELAVRASLGAARGRLVRQLLTEGLVLALLGAGGALVLGWVLIEGARRFDPGAIPRLGEVGLDAPVLLFTMGAALVTALLFGLLPALRLTAGDVAGAARSGQGGRDRRARLTGRALVAGEVAMAVILLTGAGLLLRSLSAILDRDGGFRTDGVASGHMHLPAENYDSYEAGFDFLERATLEVGALPGVEEVGLTLSLPVRGVGGMSSGVLVGDGERTDTRFRYRVADSGYFRALEIPLVEGRWFESADDAGAPHSAVVDRAMAEALWPGESALGKRFNPQDMDPWPDEWLTVVGVAGDVGHWGLDPGSAPGYYVHARQRPAFLAFFGVHLVARGPDAAALAGAIRERVQALDPDVPVRVSTLSRQIAGSAADRRFTAFVFGGFAGLALLLAAAGIYGVVANAAAGRTREMGIRLAIGARPAQVRGTIQAEALTGAAVGAALGLAGALVLARTLRGILFEVGAADPVALLGGLALLGAAAWMASWIPARRGTRLDPARTLREE